MNTQEKIELLKPTIYQLYVNEGRSRNYISKLLDIPYQALSKYLVNQAFKQKQNKTKPSDAKFLNKNRLFIKSKLDNNEVIGLIAKDLNVEYSYLRKLILNDDILSKALSERKLKNKKSKRNFNFTNIPHEKWKPIMGYETYLISDQGRIKKLDEKQRKYYLLVATPNVISGYLYVMLYKNGKRKNLSLARLVGHAFIPGYSEKNNTINHINGDITDNKASNLEWISQSNNNKHSYRQLNRNTNNHGGPSKYEKIIYKNKYEFKTVRALAKFLKVSETQAHRYIKEPKKHDLKIIKR